MGELHLQVVADRLRALGERPYRIGRVERRGPDEPALVFASDAAET